jgi:hypothetical protein
MGKIIPDITIPVDYANPGQYFACCGLLELAEKLWPGSEGWFEVGAATCAFHIAARPEATLVKLLETAKGLEFTAVSGGGAKEGDDGRVDPIVVSAPLRLVLDWWADKSIKTWAGRMEEDLILGAMLRAIRPSDADPFNSAAPVVLDPKGKKREPFYFDCRRGFLGHALDSGFSADKQGMESECFPAVEALCFIGLQRARPALVEEARPLRYTVWTERLPANVIAPVVCGLVPVHGSVSLSFSTFPRDDEGRYKSYSRAALERNENV